MWVVCSSGSPDRCRWGKFIFLNLVPVFFLDLSDSLSDVQTAAPSGTILPPLPPPSNSNPAQLESEKASQSSPWSVRTTRWQCRSPMPAPDPEPEVHHVLKSQCKSQIQKSRQGRASPSRDQREGDTACVGGPRLPQRFLWFGQGFEKLYGVGIPPAPCKAPIKKRVGGKTSA